MNRRSLRKRFITKINNDDSKGIKTYSDSNAGFRKFLKDLGVEPFNYKNGGIVRQGFPRLAKKGWNK